MAWRLYPRNDLAAIVQEDGWVPGPFWMGAENSPLLGFDPPTFQPVVSHYTNYTILASVVFGA